MSSISPETATSRKFTKQDNSVLRDIFGGDDARAFGGMSIVAPRGLQPKTRPEADDPRARFLYNDRETRAFLLRNFPDLDNDRLQRLEAGKWLAVIHYYFRMGLPDSTIEAELDWYHGNVGSIVQKIRRKIRGLRPWGKPYSLRKRGRPKKSEITEKQAA